MSVVGIAGRNMLSRGILCEVLKEAHEKVILSVQKEGS